MYKSNPQWNKLMPTCWSWIAFRLFRFLYLVDLMSLQIMETWFEMISTVSAFASIGKQSQRGVPCNSASLASHQEDWYTVCGLQSTHEMPGDCGDRYEISQTLTSWAAMHFSHLSGFAGAECAVSGMDGGLCQQGLREGDRWHTVTYL